MAINAATAPQIACPSQSRSKISVAHPKKKTAIPDRLTAGQK
jgi:hypothetical protein